MLFYENVRSHGVEAHGDRKGQLPWRQHEGLPFVLFFDGGTLRDEVFPTQVRMCFASTPIMPVRDWVGRVTSAGDVTRPSLPKTGVATKSVASLREVVVVLNPPAD